MSYQAINFVRDNLNNLSVTQRCVAYALASHADKDGGNIFPSMALIARETGLKHRRSAERVVRRLEKNTVLIAETPKTGGRKITTRYRLNLEYCDQAVALPDKETATPQPQNSDREAAPLKETATGESKTATGGSHERFRKLKNKDKEKKKDAPSDALPVFSSASTPELSKQGSQENTVAEEYRDWLDGSPAKGEKFTPSDPAAWNQHRKKRLALARAFFKWLFYKWPDIQIAEYQKKTVENWLLSVEGTDDELRAELSGGQSLLQEAVATMFSRTSPDPEWVGSVLVASLPGYFDAAREDRRKKAENAKLEERLEAEGRDEREREEAASRELNRQRREMAADGPCEGLFE